VHARFAKSNFNREFLRVVGASPSDWLKAARKHRVQDRRQWRKVHPAMDPVTSDIRAVEFTPNPSGDSPVLPAQFTQIPDYEQDGAVTADGAYGTRRCHTAIIDRQATSIIPIRNNGRPWKDDCPAAWVRNENCAPHGITAEPSGSTGPDTMPAAGSRQRGSA